LIGYPHKNINVKLKKKNEQKVPFREFPERDFYSSAAAGQKL
jgi:hypothetical protein